MRPSATAAASAAATAAAKAASAVEHADQSLPRTRRPDEDVAGPRRHPRRTRRRTRVDGAVPAAVKARRDRPRHPSGVPVIHQSAHIGHMPTVEWLIKHFAAVEHASHVGHLAHISRTNGDIA